MIPETVRSKLKHYHESFSESLTATNRAKFQGLSYGTQEQIKRCWAGSDFCAEWSCRNPGLLFHMIDRRDLQKTLQYEDFAAELRTKISLANSEEQLMSHLRHFRNFHQIRIIWRELNQIAPPEATMAELSSLAQCCVHLAYSWLYTKHSAPYNTLQTNGLKQHLVVIALGKLGAEELNLSSDIDLIFCYPENTEISKGSVTSSYKDFFTHLAQRLIHVLHTQTQDGFAFRVDMRLRPNGNSGPLVCSFAAMEQYYQDHGRDWERYAMIKARVIAGDIKQGKQLMLTLNPFIYRRYLDFSTIESLRNIKRLIQRSITRKNSANDIKRGPGGIREIEFICHSFQLIYGGKNKYLQQHSLLKTLNVLKENRYLPEKTCDELRQAYLFLRRVEHALQALRDQQTQLLPSGMAAKDRLAYTLDFPDWTSFYQTLTTYRNHVSEFFRHIVKNPAPRKSTDNTMDQWYALWCNRLQNSEKTELLKSAGFIDPERIRNSLSSLRESRKFKAVRRQSEERVNRIIPMLIDRASRTNDPDQAILKTIPIVEAVLRRTAYIVLLIENPEALEHLVGLCSSSPWSAEQIALYPILLDEFLDADALYHMPTASEARSQLHQQLSCLPEDDLETQMEVMRYFKTSNLIKLSAVNMHRKLSVAEESLFISQIAEVILEKTLQIAWSQFILQNKIPEGIDVSAPSFIIVGYGKLGSFELTPDSDLDLVFIYDETTNCQAAFYTRLGQYILHLLQTMTTMGTLYEIDMRLRPSGKSGLLVSVFSAFEQYQFEKAWFWERQALVRARCVTGSKILAGKFAILRHQILTKKRDATEIKTAALKMRKKIATQENANRKRNFFISQSVRTKNTNENFHLKSGSGAITDIEFIAQCGVLICARNFPAITAQTDTIKILEKLKETDLLTEAELSALQGAYTIFRKTVHLCMQQKKGLWVPVKPFITIRTQVEAIWEKFFSPEK